MRAYLRAQSHISKQTRTPSSAGGVTDVADVQAALKCEDGLIGEM